MKTKQFFIALCAALLGLCTLSATAQTTETLSLNEGWQFLQKENVAQTSLDAATGWTSVNLPHSWNALDGQDGGNNYKRGAYWYRKTLTVPTAVGQKVAYLHFAAANMTTTVYIDGALIGTHTGGYAHFMFDVTNALAGKTTAVLDVKVDNSASIMSPPLGGDFTFFGGITRDLTLELVPKTHISPLHTVSSTYLTQPIQVANSGVRIKQRNVSAASATIDVNVQLRNALSAEANRTLVVTVYDKENTVRATAQQAVALGANAATSADLQLNMSNPHLWNGKADPYMHRVVVELRNGATVEHRVEQPLGLRFYEFDKAGGFKLNGVAYPLRGIAIHDAFKDKGRAVSDAERQLDLDLMLETGANYLRLSHYQHGDFTYQYLDEKGIICWTEIPVVEQTAPNAASHPEFLQNCTSQLYELIRQLENHPSVICWGVANEVRQATGVNQKTTVQHLHNVVGSEDDRPSALAHNGWYEECAVTDIVSFNIYNGWYGGSYDNFGGSCDNYNSRTSHPVGVSEYGAGGNIFQHEYPAGKPTTTGQWHPEEYMNAYHESHLRQIATRPYLWQTSVWVGIDFASDHRDEGNQPGINDKGLVTFDRQVKKDAFYLYKAYWNTDVPTLYITSRRYTSRTGTTFPVRVYTNCDEVTLFVNDVRVGTVTASNHVAEWMNVTGVVGENRIKVTSNYNGEEQTDEVTWICKEATNPTDMEEAEIQINFGNSAEKNSAHPNTPAVEGYLFDCGEAYAPRENGYAYGWQTDICSEGRHRTSYTTDTRLASFIQMKANTWKIKLPNGRYRVGVSVGDNDYTDSHHVVEANGVSIVDFTPADGRKFGADWGECEVTDGYLTLKAGQSSNNTKINFVHIHCIEMEPVAAERVLYFAGTNPSEETIVSRLETIELVTNNAKNAPAEKPFQVIDEEGHVLYNAVPAIKTGAENTYTLTLSPAVTATGRYTLLVPEQSVRLQAGGLNTYEHRFTFQVKDPVEAMYETNYDGQNSSHSERYTSTISLTSPAHGLQTVSTGQGLRGALVVDLTEAEEPFVCKPGETLSAAFGFTGTWMNMYVYIDENKNGFEASDADINASHVLQKGTNIDLRAYSNYKDYNSLGTSTNGGNSQSVPSFTAPTTPGTYRIRYKVDWSCIDPKGNTASDNKMSTNGGIIVDMLLNVIDEDAPVEPDPDYKMPVFLFAGQSNMDGRAAISTYPQYMTDYKNNGAPFCQWSYCNGKTWAWEKFGGRFLPYQPYNDQSATAMTNTGFDGVVYHQIEEALQKKFYVIKESLGGAPIDPSCESWQKAWWYADAEWMASHNPQGDNASLTKEFTQNIALCVDNVLSQLQNGYDIKCIVWHQGCSDRAQAARYKKNLFTLVKYLRKSIADKTGNPKYLTLPFICCNINPNSTQYDATVDQAKHELAQEMTNFYEVSFADCSLGSDNLHHDAAGNIEGAGRVYEKLVELGLVTTAESTWSLTPDPENILEPEEPEEPTQIDRLYTVGSIQYSADDPNWVTRIEDIDFSGRTHYYIYSQQKERFFRADGANLKSNANGPRLVLTDIICFEGENAESFKIKTLDGRYFGGSTATNSAMTLGTTGNTFTAVNGTYTANANLPRLTAGILFRVGTQQLTFNNPDGSALTHTSTQWSGSSSQLLLYKAPRLISDVEEIDLSKTYVLGCADAAKWQAFFSPKADGTELFCWKEANAGKPQFAEAHTSAWSLLPCSTKADDGSQRFLLYFSGKDKYLNASSTDFSLLSLDDATAAGLSFQLVPSTTQYEWSLKHGDRFLYGGKTNSGNQYCDAIQAEGTATKFLLAEVGSGKRAANTAALKNVENKFANGRFYGTGTATYFKHDAHGFVHYNDGVLTPATSQLLLDGEGGVGYTMNGITLTSLGTLPVTIGTVKCATLWSPVDLSLVEGVKAYVGTLSGDGVVSLEAVSSIPAETAVFLYGEAGTYQLPIATSSDVVDENVFTGQLLKQTSLSNVLTLSRLQNGGDDSIGFYKYNGDVPGFHAYIDLASHASIREFSFEFTDDGVVTAISTALAAHHGNAKVYDLQGRRVRHAKNGVYVVNGRKIIVK